MKENYLPYLLALYLLLFSLCSSAQGHFVPAWGANQNAEDYMTFLLAQVKVNGEDLTAGDEVGFFDGEYCVGVAVLTEGLQEVWDGYNYQAAAGIDDIDPTNDPQNKEITGFTPGNPMSFKLWDASEEEEITTISAGFWSITQQQLPPQTYSLSRKFILTLNAVHNYTPKARAGNDFIIDEAALGQLDGSASSDKENSPLTFTWLDLDNLGISANNVAQPSFTAPQVTEDTNYRLVLTVNDGEKTSKPDTVIVTVEQVDLPPIANAGADFEVGEGERGQLDGSLSIDPDGLDISYSWTIVPAGITLDDAAAVQTGFKAPMVKNDTEYLAILTVTNSISLSDKDTVLVKVVNHNRIPLANAGPDQIVNEGDTIKLDGSASIDPDNAPNTTLSYHWFSLQSLAITGANTVSPSAVAPFFLKDSVLHFVLLVNDGWATSAPDTVAVLVQHANLMPTAVIATSLTINEGEPGMLDGTSSSDADDDELTYRWTSDYLTLDDRTSPTPAFVAPEVDADTTVWVSLVVNDGELNSEPDTVWVSILHVNKMPVWVEVPADTVIAGKEYSATIEVADPDKLDVLNISSDELPEWLVITDHGNGTATLATDSIPDMESLVGTHSFILHASDGTASIDTLTILTITIGTGMANLQLSKLSVYPNPTSGIIHLDFNRVPAKETLLQVYNHLGQKVAIRTINQQNSVIDLSAHPAGMYYFKIISDGLTLTEKIIHR